MKIFIFACIFLVLGSAVTVYYQKTQQADINYYQGHRLFAENKFDKAIPFYKKALLADPFKLKSLRELAFCYQWTGKLDDAADILQKIVLIDPKDNKAKKLLAQTYSWKKEYKISAFLYKEAIRADKNDLDAKKQLAEVYIWDRQFDKAKEILEAMLKDNSKDFAAKLLLAKALHYSGHPKEAIKIYKQMTGSQSIKEKEAERLIGEAYAADENYPEAIKRYNEILKANPKDMKARLGLADVLSWNKQYKQALDIYDGILAKGEDQKVRLQKARVLGWAKQYDEAVNEYKKILSAGSNDFVELEMKAKTAYWNNRVKTAIASYEELIMKDGSNLEARFDLSQIYSYQSMWNDAVREYKDMLDLSGVHFRAKEGLKKANLISKHALFSSGYEYFKAESVTRDTDINRNSFISRVDYPVNEHLNISARDKLSSYSFSDFSDITKNDAKLSFDYVNNPDWRMSGFYDFIEYNRGIHNTNVFGANAGVRVFDFADASFFYEKELLENNSTVIRNKIYDDNYKGRLSVDINSRAKAGADYTYARYSDGNTRNEPGFDLSYLFSMDPKRLSLGYRYFFRDFKTTTTDYFSLKKFWTNSVLFDWKHFLNKKEIFFGADDFYYGLGYHISVDSEDIVSHAFSAGLNWDINKRLNFNVSGSFTDSSARVYKDRNITANLKYYL